MPQWEKAGARSKSFHPGAHRSPALVERPLCAQEFIIPPPRSRLPHTPSLAAALAAPISPPEPKKVQGSKGVKNCWCFSSEKHLSSYGRHLRTRQDGNKPHSHTWGWQGRALAQVTSKMHDFMVLPTLATLLGARAGWEFLGKAVFHRKTLIYQESIFNTGI